MQRVAAFVCGAMFATGLAISGMIQPAKVIGFLDFTGKWDPSLAFVMGGALLVFGPGYRLVTRRKRPVLAPEFDLPKAQEITRQLIAGAVLFGVGWAIAGFCPAAAIAALAGLSRNAIAVTVGMAIGIVAMRTVRSALAPKAPPTSADF